MRDNEKARHKGGPLTFIGELANDAHTNSAFDAAQCLQRVVAWFGGNIGDHVTKFAFGGKGLEGDIDVLLAQYAIHMCQHSGQIVVQVRDAAHALAFAEIDLRKVHGQGGRTLGPVIFKTL